MLVVCNGCQDQTAQVARQKAPLCTVIEIPVASKVAALNAGDQMAAYFPRFYVDADVELTYPSLLAVAKAACGGRGVVRGAEAGVRPGRTLVPDPSLLRCFPGHPVPFG